MGSVRSSGGASTCDRSARGASSEAYTIGGRSLAEASIAGKRAGGFSLPATLTETRAILAGLTRGAALAREAQAAKKTP